MHFLPWYFRFKTVIEGIVVHTSSFFTLVLQIIQRDCESSYSWSEVATRLLAVPIPSGCRGVMSTPSKVVSSTGVTGVVFVNLSFVNLLSSTAWNSFIFCISTQIQSIFSFIVARLGSFLKVSNVAQSFSSFYCVWFSSVFSMRSLKVSGDALREKCPDSELFWSAFSGMRTEYGEMRSMSECGHFLRSDGHVWELLISLAI